VPYINNVISLLKQANKRPVMNNFEQFHIF